MSFDEANKKAAAEALGMPPSKFDDWWLRTKRKLASLHQKQPDETAAEIAAIMAEAEAERKVRLS